MRAWDWLLELAGEHDVELVLLGTDEGVSSEAAHGVAASVTRLETTQVGSRARRAARAVPLLSWCWLGLTAGWHRPVELPTGLVERSEASQRIVVFRLHSHLVGRQLGGRDTVRELDLDDREARTWRGLAASQWRLGRPRDSLVSLLTSWQYVGAEARVAWSYHRIYVAASQDLPRRRRSQVTVRPNRLNLRPRVMDAEAWSRLPPRLLFVGTLNYPPNEEAARWLAGPFREEVSRRGLPWEIWIAGMSPSERLTKTLDVPGVRLFADAPDLGALYRQVRVALVPLRSGGGTKFKTVEAIAHGVPVVGLAQARRGLPLRHGEHMILVRHPRGLVASVAALLAMDATEVAAMTRRARDRLLPTWIHPTEQS